MHCYGIYTHFYRIAYFEKMDDIISNAGERKTSRKTTSQCGNRQWAFYGNQQGARRARCHDCFECDNDDYRTETPGVLLLPLLFIEMGPGAAGPFFLWQYLQIFLNQFQSFCGIDDFRVIGGVFLADRKIMPVCIGGIFKAIGLFISLPEIVV